MDDLVSRIEAVWQDTPIQAAPQYVAYCWLWAQLLRCSHKLRPTMVAKGDWRNLAWYPLYVLAGKAGNPEASDAAWRAWYYQWVQVHHPQPDQAQLEGAFPWIPPPGVQETDQAMRHLSLARMYEEHHSVPIPDVFEKLDITGRRWEDTTRLPPWHPWLLLMFPFPTNFERPRFKQALNDLLEDRELADAFMAFLRRATPDSVEARLSYLRNIDTAVKKLHSRGKQNVWRQRRIAWRKQDERAMLRSIA